MIASRASAGSPPSGYAVLKAFESSVRLLRWGLGGAFLLYLTSGVGFVGPNEEAVVYRLGRLQGTRSPGLLLALPPPFDTVVRVPSRTAHELALSAWAGDPADQPPARRPGDEQHAHLAAAAAGMRNNVAGFLAPKARALHPARDGYTITADANLVQGRFAVRYRIKDAVAWVSHAQSVEPLLAANSYRAFTHALAGRTVDDALTAGQTDITIAVRRMLQTESDRLQLGLEIDRVEIREIAPPRAVVPAFDAVVSAQVEARTAVEQAHTYEAEILPKARAEAYRLRSEADSASAELVARSQGESSAFNALLTEYLAAPELLRSRLAAETRTRVLPKLKYKTVLPAGPANVKLFLREEK